MNILKKILYVTGTFLVLNACTEKQNFTIKGDIADAEGKTLIFEASGIEGTIELDSVKLKGNGSFTFKGAKPESPEFYRLRIDDKIINFSIDSTETVEIKARMSDYTTGYQVIGSESSQKIKELTIRQINLQKEVNALIRANQSRQLSNDIFEDSVNSLITAYKDTVKMKYIYVAPYTAPAYFALFQTLNNYFIFDPLNSKEDVKCFAAVATSFNNFYPHAVRSRNLYNLAIKGMRNTRTAKESPVEIPEEMVRETGIIDIDLKDIKGTIRSLSALQGKVVLLDFTVYQSAVSAPHNMTLFELYEKYADKGLEIYQVSLDADEHYWKTVADQLPWVCVRDANGVYSSYAAMYNVSQLPSIFLINKNNELNMRGEEINDLDAAIRRLL